MEFHFINYYDKNETISPKWLWGRGEKDCRLVAQSRFCDYKLASLN
jgi:hypothetical protein